jgi:hypothetical protein
MLAIINDRRMVIRKRNEPLSCNLRRESTSRVSPFLFQVSTREREAMKDEPRKRRGREKILAGWNKTTQRIAPLVPQLDTTYVEN